MNKFNLVYENIKKSIDNINTFHSDLSNDELNKCTECNKKINGKGFQTKNENLCLNCFLKLIKKNKKKYSRDLLLEGGHAFNNVSPIQKENIKSTLDSLNDLVFKPLNIPANMWTAELGSTGKKDISGDIDIAININGIMDLLQLDNDNDIKNMIIDQLNKNKIENKKIGANIHICFPIQGSQVNDFVQIDIFPSIDLEYTKHHLWSPKQGDSKYKGQHRNDLLRSLIIAVSMNIADDATDEEKQIYIDPDGKKYPALRFSYISMSHDGFYQITKSFKGKKGLLNQAKLDNAKTKFITRDFQEMLDILFGVGRYTINDLYSFETIWNNILMDKDFPYKDKLDDIIQSLHILLSKHKDILIPDEIINYLEQNN